MKENIPTTTESANEPENPTDDPYFSFFIPQKNYFATPVLIYINLLVFGAMVFSGVSFFNPEISDLIGWGANVRSFIQQGEYWRLFTSEFVHIGLLHLLFNMYALFYIGFFLEPVIGSINFTIYYLLAGLTGSVASMWWHEFTVSAGASGAIFGMYGLFLALLTTNLISKPEKKNILYSILFFIGYNILSGMSAQGGIDNASHFGGLLAGLIGGYLMFPIEKNKGDRKIISAIGILLIATVWFAGKNKIASLPDPMGKFEKNMTQFSELEKEAIKALQYPEGTPSEIIIEALDKGVDNWKQCQQLVAELKREHLPDHLIDRLTIIDEYVRLRINLYHLYAKALKENSAEYDVEIKQIIDKISEILENLQ